MKVFLKNDSNTFNGNPKIRRIALSIYEKLSHQVRFKVVKYRMSKGEQNHENWLVDVNLGVPYDLFSLL